MYENKRYQCILSSMETITESSVQLTTGSEVRELERGIMVAIGPYSEILKERGNLESHLCLLS
jgi:hypothetical protein